MIRYIYILGYEGTDGKYTLCKVDIDYDRILRYGCKESNRHPELRYVISRQSIKHNSKISLYARIYPSETYMN